jgi:DnaK suppressor protein
MASRKKTTNTRRKPAAAKQEGTQFYERRLTQMRDDLMNLVKNKKATELTDLEVGDEADIATQSAERELLFELSDNERQMLDSIEAALRKISQGRYGQCESCQKRIPRLRLRALPQARYCVPCQARFERPR